MSIEVELDEVREQVAACRSCAYLLTVTDDGRPHAVSLEVGWQGDELVVRPGQRTTGQRRTLAGGVAALADVGPRRLRPVRQRAGRGPDRRRLGDGGGEADQRRVAQDAGSQPATGRAAYGSQSGTEAASEEVGSMAEAIEMYRRSVEEFGQRVMAIGADDWNRPTPCSDWSVRDLVRHLVYEELWAPPLLAGATVADIGDRFEGDILGDDPQVAWKEAAAHALAAASPDHAWAAPSTCRSATSPARSTSASSPPTT